MVLVLEVFCPSLFSLPDSKETGLAVTRFISFYFHQSWTPPLLEDLERAYGRIFYRRPRLLGRRYRTPRFVFKERLRVTVTWLLSLRGKTSGFKWLRCPFPLEPIANIKPAGKWIHFFSLKTLPSQKHPTSNANDLQN